MSQFESQFEEDLYRARLDTLEKIVALGQQAYPNTFAFTHTVPELLPLGLTPDGTPKPAEALEAEHLTAAIAGRIVAIRLQGKAGFATLLQNGARLQIYVRRDDVGDPAFDLYKLLDLGDHIGVRGTLMRTRTGELTLKAGSISLPGDEVYPGSETPAVRAAPLTFLTKALLPLPDKYSGLGDIELRYRRRYLDLFTDTGDVTEPSPTPEPGTNSSSAVILSEAKDPRILPEAAPQPGAPGLASETWEGPPQPPTEPTFAALPEGSGGFSPLNNATSEGASALEGQPLAPHQTRLPAREVFVKRAAILRSIRNFFDTRGYLEVETPMLHTVAGGAAARPFTTHHNALDIPLSLRIAPELYLKRLVVGGLDRVYEINRNFRNEGVSTSHNPEFTMLEFYQAYANYHDLMDLTQDLITTVAQEVNGTTITKFGDHGIDLSKWTKLSMREAIIKWWPENFTEDFGPVPTVEELSSLDGLRTVVLRILEATERGMNYAIDLEAEAIPTVKMFSSLFRQMLQLIDKDENWGKPISILFEFVSERFLIHPTIIYDFPLAVSPLSKVKPDEPDWVERFEFYIGGFEVGNAFSELNDPVDQRNRFAAQVADKDPESMAEIDEDYVRALGYGLPPTAGEGIGIDRLTMILTGSRSIRDVILFPLMRPHKPTLEKEVEEPHGESAE